MEKDNISENAIGIHLMLRNKAGNFPNLLADLSGLEFEKSINNTDFPCFHYSRYQNCAFGKKQKGNYFYFTADITLEEKADENVDIGAVVLSLPSLNKSNKQDGMRDKMIRNIDSLIFPNDSILPNGKYKKLWAIGIGKSRYIYLNNNSTIENKKDIHKLLTEECVFQATTPPEIYRAKLFNLLNNWEFYKGFTKKDANSNAKAEIERAYINTEFKYEFKENDKNNLLGKPLAKLYLCCRHGDRPGALATAINTLFFRKYTHNNKGNVFNIKFLIDYFSYSPSVAYNAIYGHLEERKQNMERIEDEDCAKNVIERILICPITQDSKWREYAKELWGSLGSERYYARAGRLQKDISNGKEIPENPQNILIYRKERLPCYIRDDSKLLRPDKGCDICRKFHWLKSII